MTPDEAIALTKNYKKTFHFYTTWKDAACVLAGEVERLRLDVQRLVDANEEYHGDALALEQERDELRRRVDEFTNPKPTNCWKCSDTYEIKLAECPHCGAANANVNWELAKDQIQIEGGE